MTHDELEPAVHGLAGLVVSMNDLLHETTWHVDALHALLEQPVVGREEFKRTVAHLRQQRAKQRQALRDLEWIARSAPAPRRKLTAVDGRLVR